MSDLTKPELDGVGRLKNVMFTASWMKTILFSSDAIFLLAELGALVI